MARDALTGSRIRERRLVAGLKQSELARVVGISASYLNLIEHNRRRIGGKLLVDIAAALGVEPATLSQGAAVALVAGLQEAAQRAHMPVVDVARAEEFAGRFPAWAEAMAASHRRITDLERMVETLSDRLAHDPELAASVHEVLSTAAAIRSTASILAEDKTITPAWRDRFHDNIDADSRRLANSAKALVGFLDGETGEAASIGSPQEEVASFLARNGYTFPTLEIGHQNITQVLDEAPELVTAQARDIAWTSLERFVEDANLVSLRDLKAAIQTQGSNVIRLAEQFGVGVPVVLRRLAAVPEIGAGLVVCDRAGSLMFRKDVEGFGIPRHGAACPLWPLFQALGQPGQVVRSVVQTPNQGQNLFECIATTAPVGPQTWNAPPLQEATMLILPLQNDAVQKSGSVLKIGPACRICPRSDCAGRREPSILSDGFRDF